MYVCKIKKEMEKTVFTVILSSLLMFCTACAQNKIPSSENEIIDNNGPDKNIRAVFIGNSITEIWKWDHPTFFSRNSYVNKGIGGQTTNQMLARFQADVVDLHPQCVVIMGGINDIAHNEGYSSTLDGIKDNIAAMATLAIQNDIDVIICSTTPAQNVNWNIPVPDATQKVVSLNAMLREYADVHTISYADFHSLLRANDDKLKAEYCRGNGDSVHLAPTAYYIIEPIIKCKIDSLLMLEK